MSTFTETVVETFHVVSCYSCSLRFGITRELYRRAVSDAVGHIYCPACGSMTVWKESDAQREIAKLKAEAVRLGNEKQMADQRASMERATAERAIAEKMKVERKLKRANAGVCTCCNRTFLNLARHMATKHDGKAFVAPKLSAVEKAKARGFKTV